MILQFTFLDKNVNESGKETQQSHSVLELGGSGTATELLNYALFIIVVGSVVECLEIIPHLVVVVGLHKF